MKSICFFSSYFQKNEIPPYVKIYLEELSRHFNEVILITNENQLIDTEIQYLYQNNINYLQVVNEGFDFGMWYKAMKSYDILQYERIGLINDSCILFKSLDETFSWINAVDLDYCGMVSSIEISYHIQSYFIIINKKAIPFVYDYFMKNDIKENILEVIHCYEVGLSSHLIDQGLKLGAIFNSTLLANPSFVCIKHLLEQGMPLIKKKIILNSFREDEYPCLFGNKLNIDPRYYVKLIKQNNTADLIFDMDTVLKDVINPSFIYGIYWFKVRDIYHSLLVYFLSFFSSETKYFIKKIIYRNTNS